MPTEPASVQTLKQEKYWYIDQNGKTIYYDVAKDVEAGWWHKINTRTDAEKKY